MPWNYRIVRYRDQSGYGLHEVFYDDAGEPYAMTQKPVSFVCHEDEGPDGIIDSLVQARTDAKRRPVLNEPKKWPGKNPADTVISN